LPHFDDYCIQTGKTRLEQIKKPTGQNRGHGEADRKQIGGKKNEV